MIEYKLYVWDDVLTDNTSGIAVAVAETVEQARATILAKAEGYEKKELAKDIAEEPNEVLDLPAAAYCWGGG